MLLPDGGGMTGIIAARPCRGGSGSGVCCPAGAGAAAGSGSTSDAAADWKRTRFVARPP